MSSPECKDARASARVVGPLYARKCNKRKRKGDHTERASPRPKRVVQVDATKAIAYIRCSTSRQDLSPDAQCAAIEAWAERESVERPDPAHIPTPSG